MVTTHIEENVMPERKPGRSKLVYDKERQAIVTVPTSPAPSASAVTPEVSRMFIHSICTAYESGMGRGCAGRDLAQPYDPESPQGIAYHEGWTQGIDRYNDGADDE
jgi:hypothetical protein